MLRPIGFLVQSAPDGETALALVEEAPPDLILLDIDMPSMGGWALSGKLRANPALRSTPIIVVSGHALEARQPVERKGLYDAFVVKPFTLPNLVARIGELLRLEFTSDRRRRATNQARTEGRVPSISGGCGKRPPSAMLPGSSAN